MKFIRECRIGTYKCFKTGAVAGTYPKPMLCLMFDQGGLDVIQSKVIPVTPGNIVMDVVAEDIVYIKSGELKNWITKPASEQPKVLAIQFFKERKCPIDANFKPVADIDPFLAVVNTIDLLFRHENLPWQTVLFDGVTGYMDVILSGIASANSSALADARQWAYQVGLKVKQTVAALSCLNAHIIVLMHTEFEKNELTGVITEGPSVYSNFRNEVGCYFSQFFYQTKVMGRPKTMVNDYNYIKGLGPRWPTGLPDIVEPDFKSIYGKEFGLT